MHSYTGGMALFLSGQPEADSLLSEDPLALLIGMVLDQQVPLEKAFKSPFDLRERLGGTLDAATLASMDPEELAAVFSERPALHRFPRLNGGTGAGALRPHRRHVPRRPRRHLDIGGRPARSCFANVKALPGFGEQKARIFVALLGKQLGVRPRGWEKAAGPFGEAGTFRSVADIHSPETLAKVRAVQADR